MAKKSVRPKLFESQAATKKYMGNVAEALIQKTLDAGMDAATQGQPENVKVKRRPKYVEVTQKRLDNLGVIDLKPFFAASPKRRDKEGGGWYLIVPIKRSAKSMSRRSYEQVRGFKTTPEEKNTVIADYMYDRRRTSGASMLNYEPKSKRMDKISQGKKRHSYVAFRTVSSSSPANSWILNRDKVNEKDTSKTFVDNVNRLMAWKMKNGWD